MRLRLLIVVTHLLGAGHLTRAAALARAFARAGHDVVLASGGMPAALVGTEGVTLVQLPPVQTAGTDFRTLLDETGHPVAPSRLEARREMLLDQVAEMRPDVIVTELFPFGRRILAGEFMGVIEAAKASRPDTLVLASVRDILVCPAKAERIVEAHERLRRFYDAVLVHGDPDLVRLDASWPLDGAAQALVRYTGYVDDGAPVEATADLDGGAILVSGGSSAASLPLYRAAVATAALVPETRWRILVGRGVAEAAFAALRASAPANAVVERARPDFRALLGQAAVSVSQAGYNTVMDVLRARVRAIFVPFEQGHETEQRLRAERLADTGIGTIIAEQDLAPAVLAERVREALSHPHAPASSVSLDGAERSVAIVDELAASRFGRGRARSGTPSPWRALDDALSRAGDAGVTIPFWWRDDDAVAHTRALDRLLALARRFEAPLVLAAIPAKVEDSLVQRLHDEPRIAVTVHGLSHGNHAPEGAKKAEFGAHRPLPSLAEDAREGLRLAQTRFGDRLAPIFVPPWNRIAPELTGLLPGLGFAGLSTFGERIAREPARGLLQVNTHVDPIDWRQGGRLRDLEAVLSDLAALIVRRVAHDVPEAEPIGLLTHHLVQDEAVWAACEELLGRLAAHRSVRFADVAAMFVGAQTSAT